jgi:hypothetical protein
MGHCRIATILSQFAMNLNQLQRDKFSCILFIAGRNGAIAGLHRHKINLQ